MLEDLKHKVLTYDSLPSLPAVATKIISVIQDGDFGLHDIARIVSDDPAIAAKLVKLSNSAAYTCRAPCGSIDQAVMRLGLDATVMTSLSFSLADTFKERDGRSLDVALVWRRSILSAGIAKLWAGLLGQEKQDEWFLAALIQDIGMLALDCVIDGLYSDVDREQPMHREAVALETARLGIDHAIVGGWLLESWGFPESTVTAVTKSHSVSIRAVESRVFSMDWCVAYSGTVADALIAEDKENLARALSFVESVTRTAEVELVEKLASIVAETEALFVTSAAPNVLELMQQSKQLLLERVARLTVADDKRRLAALEDRVETLEEENRRDALTGVYNRAHFDQAIVSMVDGEGTAGQEVSLLFVDADRFKEINDTHGHVIGDKVLAWIASSLQSATRDTDVVARYGGEEFVVILSGVNEAQAMKLAERILHAFRAGAVECGGQAINVTVSIGVASTGSGVDRSSAAELVLAADQAMYLAKTTGRDRCVNALVMRAVAAAG